MRACGSLPSGWRVGDKTGSGERGTTKDVGIIFPPGRMPILIAVYLTETTLVGAERNATLASTGRAAAAKLDS